MKRNRNWTRLGIAGVLLGLLLCLSACSDMVLNPDGSISYVGSMTLAEEQATADDPPATSGSETGSATDPTGEYMTLEPAPAESETAGTVVIRPNGDPFADAAHTLYADFLATGKSDCILLRMDGQVVLIDTGDRNDATLLCQTLDGYGITRIDYLILTHYDNDHIGSAETVLERYEVGTVYMPDYVRNSKLYRTLDTALTAAEISGTEVHRLYAQDIELELGYGSLWINATGMAGYEPGQILGADEDNEDTDENNFSLITAVRFGDKTLLLCGDAEGERMAEYLPLATARGISSCSLLKVPHHGASADKGLLDAVRAWRPRYCVVCTDAAQNVSGAILTNMRTVGAGQYFTYDGKVTFATDGAGAVILQDPA